MATAHACFKLGSLPPDEEGASYPGQKGAEAACHGCLALAREAEPALTSAVNERLCELLGARGDWSGALAAVSRPHIREATRKAKVS